MLDVERPVDEQNDCQIDIGLGLKHLRSGGVVAFPTDTLFGLGADVFSQPALEKVFAIKGRTQGQALPVLVSGWDQVAMVAGHISEKAERLARRFWPGALTLVLWRLPKLPDLVTGGGETVAVRMPNHRVPLALTSGLGRPITGTSANRSGQADLLTREDVVAQLGHLVDHVVRHGPSPAGVASTVIDLTLEEPRLLREGALPFRLILET
ncbi:MAG: threonylcarbamoyl-AMP synthase [SAR202 cluster bacterium Io17-Chloro-G2]|nr:MAG: threonylcarbamoyl-AMP synthase [SAR202 cluster bacterium Io17-Chloro-G2]